MDNQTRFGIGGVAAGAVLIFLAIIWPAMPPLFSVPAFLLSAAIAVYGFWPWLSELPSQLSLDAIESFVRAVRLRILAWCVKEWVPADLAEDFADPDKTAAVEAAQTRVRELWRRTAELDLQITRLQAKRLQIPSQLATPEPDDLRILRAQKVVVASELQAAELLAKEAVKDVWDDIRWKLEDGELLARGHVMPHVAGHFPKVIPTPEWQFLKLYRDENLSTAKGGGIEYIGVQIGKPPKRKTRVN